MGSSENEKPKGTINNFFKAERSLGKACEGKRREREAASSDKENKPSTKRQKQSTLKVRVLVTLLG